MVQGDLLKLAEEGYHDERGRYEQMKVKPNAVNLGTWGDGD